LLAISRILTRILLVAELLLKKRERYPDRLHSPPGGVQSVLYQHEPLGRGLRDAAAAFSSKFAFRSVERVFETDQRLTLPVDGPDRFLKHWELPSRLCRCHNGQCDWHPQPQRWPTWRAVCRRVTARIAATACGYLKRHDQGIDLRVHQLQSRNRP
jgi:hypothetical protein